MKPSTKVLFTSGYTLDAISEEGIPGLGFDCIMKPASPATLLKKVRSILDGLQTTPV